MSFNKIIIVGNLGRDPELRYTPQGTAVCSFSLATNEKRKDKAGELQNITTWFRVTLWGKQAENANKFLTKGNPVYIEGRLRTEEWTDRDGKARTSLEVQATDMQFIGSRSDGEYGGGYSGGGSHDEGGFGGDHEDQGHSSAAVSSGGGGDDDIPF
jgi:single-strand DNA-binding protein